MSSLETAARESSGSVIPISVVGISSTADAKKKRASTRAGPESPSCAASQP